MHLTATTLLYFASHWSTSLALRAKTTTKLKNVSYFAKVFLLIIFLLPISSFNYIQEVKPFPSSLISSFNRDVPLVPPISTSRLLDQLSGGIIWLCLLFGCHMVELRNYCTFVVFVGIVTVATVAIRTS